jgi:hypothetical protein
VHSNSELLAWHDLQGIPNLPKQVSICCLQCTVHLQIFNSHALRAGELFVCATAVLQCMLSEVT